LVIVIFPGDIILILRTFILKTVCGSVKRIWIEYNGIQVMLEYI